MAPYFQKEFVDHLTGTPSLFSVLGVASATPIFLISLAFLSLLAQQGFNQLANFIGSREALIAQRELAQKVYEKTLELKVDTLSSRTTGEMVALYATDVPGSTILLEQTLPQGSSTFFPLLLAPIALSFLLKTSLLPTVLIMLLVSVINTGLALRQSRFFDRYKRLAAERIGFVNEWITQLRGLRILSWIEDFENKIIRTRVIETKNRVKMVTNGQMMNSISSSMTFAMNVMALGSMLLLNEIAPTSGEILASLWILGIFLTRPFRQMPWFFTFAFDAWTSIKRIESFLAIKNIDTPAAAFLPSTLLANKKNVSLDSRRPILHLEGLVLQAPQNPLGRKPLLNIAEFSILPGEFIGLVGEVGSGKSLFLLSLLKETGANFNNYQIHDQSVKNLPPPEVKRFFSYVPQESFIISASIAQNVSFDYKSYVDDQNFIHQALIDSQFQLNQERLPQGLETELGERGVNLSGGQRLRISLARAAARDAEILLIDDGFSNLDIHTEDSLLQSLFFGRWKTKTRILATHRLTVLPKTDRVVFLKDGQVANQGRYEDLLIEDPEFRTFVQSLAKTEGQSRAQ